MRLLTILLVTMSLSTMSLDGLKNGSVIPVDSMKSIEGKNINFTGQETVIIFYRGSWCSYCMAQLKSIESEIVPKLKADQQLIAISVDNLVTSKKMIRKFKFSFPIISDSKAVILKKFKIINKISDELVLKYKNAYEIDVEADSGEKHHMVAHPAVYIINKKAEISFVEVHEDYKQRTNNEKILKLLSN